MKKLVCVKDIQNLVKEGKKVCYVEDGTLVTPSAKDEALAAGIEISYGTAPCGGTGASCCTTPAVPTAAAGNGDIDSEMIYRVLKSLVDKGMLSGVFDNGTQGASDKPYSYEQDPTGLKVVRGNTVKMDAFFPDEPDKKVYYQELIDKTSSNISSGIVVIDHSTYEWTQNYDENDYVIEGTMVVTINGRTYTAHAGDCLFIPNGATVVMGSKDYCCKVFYNTYPSNWADLMEQ